MSKIKDIFRALQKITPILVKGTPLVLLHRVTLRCNCKCDFCDWWKSAKYDPGSELTLEELKVIYKQCEELGILEYAIWGGEPLMRPDFDGVLRESKRRGMISLTCTNGILLADRARELAPHMGYCIVSIDGIGDQHDKGRNFPGAFNLAMKGIEELRRAGGPARVRLWSQLNTHTIGSVKDVIGLAREMDVELEFIPTWNISCYNDHLMVSQDQMRETMEEIIHAKLGGAPIYNSLSMLRMLRDGGSFVCNAPRRVVSLDYDGRTQPCARWLEPHHDWIGPLGRESSLRDLIEDPRFISAARDLETCNECHSVCAMIHKNNVFWTRSQLLAEGLAHTAVRKLGRVYKPSS